MTTTTSGSRFSGPQVSGRLSRGLRDGLGAHPAPALLAVAGLGMLILTADDDGLVLCPLRRCTGGFCPGCGGTRAARQLAGGDLVGAWSHNPWAVLFVLQCALLAACLLVVGAPTRTRLRDRGGGAVLLPLAMINAAMAIAIWVARIHAGSIPAGWFSAL